MLSCVGNRVWTELLEPPASLVSREPGHERDISSGNWWNHRAIRDHQVPIAAVPNSAPTPAVSAMAKAPQNVTRIAPTVTPAPPARAANPPRSARNTSEVPETRGIIPAAGA